MMNSFLAWALIEWERLLFLPLISLWGKSMQQKRTQHCGFCGLVPDNLPDGIASNAASITMLQALRGRSQPVGDSGMETVF